MSEAGTPWWRRVVFPRLTAAVQATTKAVYPTYFVRRQCAKLPYTVLDPWWLRWLVTLSALSFAAALVVSCAPTTTVTWAPLAFVIGAMVFAVLLCVYFAWLLFLRLQCSLLEWIVLIAFLGNAEGLLVTTPGFGAMKAVWALAPLVAAWVLYGTVKGLVWAEILGVNAPGRRVGLLLLAWFQTAAPAMVLAGAGLLIGREMKGLVSRDLAAWGLPMLIAGVLGILARVWLERRVARAAQSILDAATPAP